MRFLILGPLQIVVGDTPEPVIGKSAAILAMLLLDRNRPVGVGRLTEAAWESDPPKTALRQIQNRVADTRRMLAGAPDCELETIGSAYRLRAADGEVDHDLFESLRTQARELADQDRPEAALEALDRALGLWRGRALAGLGGRLIESGAALLDQGRIEAVEERLDLRLRLGRFDDAIAEARELLTDHPFRERPVSQLMTGLYATGRKAEAIEAFEELRRGMADELGLDPGAAVRDVHLAILRDDLDLASRRPREGRPSGTPARVEAPRPRQLPAPVPDFTGRESEIERIERVWGGRDRTRPLAIALTGIGGAGKTALGLEWAHRHAADFPDGQLHADLRGTDQDGSAEPLAVLHRFLRSLGAAPDDLPGELDQAAAAFRAFAADKRILLFLDNARDVDQVRPLLPGTGGAVTVVTCRGRLDGLRGLTETTRLTVEEMTGADAVELLARLAGPDLVAADPDAAEAVAARCGGLPLALRIAAGLLEERPGIGLPGLADRLRTDPLDQLDRPGGGIGRVFDLSFAHLDAAEQRCLMELSLLPGSSFGESLAVALASASGQDGERLLAALTAAHLVRRSRPGRFGLHGLVAEYARSQARERLGEAERTVLRQRAVAHFRRLRGPVPMEEYGFLTAAYRAWAGLPEGAPLADVLCWYARRGHRPEELQRLGEEALRSGPGAVGPVHLARHHNLVAVAAYARGALGAAVEHGRAALAALERTESGDRLGTARANLGAALARMGREREALPLLEAAFAAAAEAGRDADAAGVALVLGWLRHRVRDFAAAERSLQEALRRFEAVGDAAGAREVHAHLGEVYRAVGRHTEARAALRRTAAAQIVHSRSPEGPAGGPERALL